MSVPLHMSDELFLIGQTRALLTFSHIR